MRTFGTVEEAAKAAAPGERVYWRHLNPDSWEDVEYILCPAGEEDIDGDFHLVSDEEIEAHLWEESSERRALLD